MLIVEADGGVHSGGQYDTDRDAWFEAKGFKVLRFRNEEIMADDPAPLFARILAVRPKPSR
jgi:very-short-patch-repair endonuclease